MSIDDEFPLIRYNIFDECDQNATTASRKDGEWFSICFVLLIPVLLLFACLIIMNTIDCIIWSINTTGIQVSK